MIKKFSIFIVIVLSFHFIVNVSAAISTIEEKSEIVQSFEEDLYDSNGGKKFKGSVLNRIDTLKYGEFTLTWEGVVGDVGCLVYTAEDSTQDEKSWRTKMKNFAFKLEKKDAEWVVMGINRMPGENPEDYFDWLKINKCK